MSAESTDTTATTDKIKPTLASILAAMQAFDDDLKEVNFNAEDIAEDLTQKVDSIHHVISRLNREAEWYAQQVIAFSKCRHTVLSNVRRLEDYVLYCMKKHSFKELPGKRFKVTVRDNPPALTSSLEESCNATHYVKYPKLVNPVHFYEWNRQAIKKFLEEARKGIDPESREFAVDELPFFKLKVGQHVRFTIKSCGEDSP